MVEILLLLFIVSWKMLKVKNKKVKEEEIEILRYNPGLISNKDIENAVAEMGKNSFYAAMLIYTQILSLLKDKTVIQFRMYGLGSIWRKEFHSHNSNGTFQLAVAFKLISKFRKKYPKISITSQDPIHTESEIEYLQNQNVQVFKEKTFSSEFFVNAMAKSDASNPVMICYMIHFCIDNFENFLHAHWHSEILSKIIFVGNLFDDSLYAKSIGNCKKTAEFFKFVSRRILPFEEPEYEDDPNLIFGYSPFHGHPSEFLAFKGFHNTAVYCVSYEDAQKIVKNL